MEALNDLVQVGKVRALGASAMYASQFQDMQKVPRDNGWTTFSAMENHYNLLHREDEKDLIPLYKKTDISLMPYSPLDADHLTWPTWIRRHPWAARLIRYRATSMNGPKTMICPSLTPCRKLQSGVTFQWPG